MRLAQAVPFFLPSVGKRATAPLQFLVYAVRSIHSGLAHSRGRVLVNSIRPVLACPYLEDIVRYVDLTCTICPRIKPPYGAHHQESTLRTSRVNDVLYVDTGDLCVECTVPGLQGMRLLQVRVDACLGRVGVSLVRSKDPAEHLAVLVRDHFAVYGAPRVVATDMGTEYESVFAEGLRAWNVLHRLSPVGHSFSNGMVERAMRELWGGLRAERMERGVRDDQVLAFVPHVVDKLNRRARADGRKSPFMATNGGHAPLFHAVTLLYSFLDAASPAHVNPACVFRVGETCVFLHPKYSFGHSGSHGMKVSGTWEEVVVEQRLGTVVYMVRAADSNALRFPSYRVIAHANQLRKLPPPAATSDAPPGPQGQGMPAVLVEPQADPLPDPAPQPAPRPVPLFAVVPGAMVIVRMDVLDSQRLAVGRIASVYLDTCTCDVHVYAPHSLRARVAGRKYQPQWVMQDGTFRAGRSMPLPTARAHIVQVPWAHVMECGFLLSAQGKLPPSVVSVFARAVDGYVLAAYAVRRDASRNVLIYDDADEMAAEPVDDDAVLNCGVGPIASEHEAGRASAEAQPAAEDDSWVVFTTLDLDKAYPVRSSGPGPPGPAQASLGLTSAERKVNLKRLTPLERAQVVRAKQREMDSFRTNSVYERVPLEEVPVGVVPLDTRYRIERKHIDGVLDMKARLVVEGNKDDRVELETKTAMPPMFALRLCYLWCVGRANFKPGDIVSGDVSTAFLISPLISKRTVYVKPPRCHPDFGRVLWRLLRAMYGLRDSPLMFARHLYSVLRGLRWERTVIDGVYIRYAVGNRMEVEGLLYCHVDDLKAFSGTVQASVMMAELARVLPLKIKPQGPCMFVGMECRMVGDDVFMSQSELASKISVDEAAGEGPYTFPLPLNTGRSDRAVIADGVLMSAREVKRYQQVLGSLNFLRNSRPDLMFALSFLGRYSREGLCTQEAWRLLKRLVHYVRATAHYGLLIRRGHSAHGNVLEAYADASFSLRSQCGYIIVWNGMLVEWASHLQQKVVTSTLKAELCALHENCGDFIFVLHFLHQLRVPVAVAHLRSDARNLVDLLRSDYPSPRERSLLPKLRELQRQMEGEAEARGEAVARIVYKRDRTAQEEEELLRHFMAVQDLRDECPTVPIVLSHVPGETNPADVFTKALDTSAFVHEYMCTSVRSLPARPDTSVPFHVAPSVHGVNDDAVSVRGSDIGVDEVRVRVSRPTPPAVAPAVRQPALPAPVPDRPCAKRVTRPAVPRGLGPVALRQRPVPKPDRLAFYVYTYLGRRALSMQDTWGLVPFFRG